MSFFLAHRRTNRPLWRRLPSLTAFVLRLAFHQERLLFQPQRAPRGTPADLGLACEEVELRGRDGRPPIAAWWLPGEPGARTVLYLPGSIGNASHELQSVAFLRSLGAGVLLFDWPGYGRSSGRPSLAGSRAAATAAWEHLTAERGVPPGEIVLWGRSFGGFLAARLAAERPAAGLVVHCGLGSVPEFAKRYLPGWLVDGFCTVRLDCRGDVARRHCPALFLHAERDEVVPIEFGRDLFARAAPPKRFAAFGSGHFDADWQRDARVKELLCDLFAGRGGRWGREG